MTLTQTQQVLPYLAFSSSSASDSQEAVSLPKGLWESPLTIINLGFLIYIRGLDEMVSRVLPSNNKML